MSLHGAEANIVRNVFSNEKVFFLLGGKVKVSEICQRLCEYSLNDTEVYIGEDLAAENERYPQAGLLTLQDMKMRIFA